MPKQSPQNKYVIDERTYKSYNEAAGAAVFMAAHNGESVAISEIAPSGKLLGYINVQASTESVD
jgi:hypothetical protein